MKLINKVNDLDKKLFETCNKFVKEARLCLKLYTVELYCT